MSHFTAGILLMLLPYVAGHMMLKDPIEDYLPLAKAALHVTEHYIGRKTNTLIIRKKFICCDRSRQNFYFDLMDYIVSHIDKSMAIALPHSEKLNHYSWNYHLFIVDSVMSFRKLLRKIRVREAEYYFLIILTHKKGFDEAELQLETTEMLEIALESQIINVVIMIEQQNGDVVFVRSDLMGPNCGENIRLIYFNRFHNGKLKNNLLFPRRMTTFGNCTIRAAIHEMSPMLMFKGDKHNESHLMDMRRLEGIEGSLLRKLLKALQLRPFFVFAEERGTVFPNGTATGCYALLNNESIKFAIGAFGAVKPHRNFFSISTSYYQNPLIFTIRSSLQCAPIRQLLQPFSRELWLLIVLLLLFAVIAMKFCQMLSHKQLYILTFGRTTTTIYLNIIEALMGQPSPIRQLPGHNFTRFLIMCWILFTLLLRYAYQGKMFDSMRISHRIPLPRTVEDLVSLNYIMIAHDYQEYYPHNLTVVVHKDYEKRFEILEKAHPSQRLTSASLVANLAHYNRFQRNSRLTMVNDPIYVYQSVIYYKKYSRWKYAFDEKLKQFISSGIISYMAKEYVKEKFLVMNNQPLSVSRISNGMLFGLYVIYGSLMGLACLVFILELLTRRSAVLSKILNKLH